MTATKDYFSLKKYKTDYKTETIAGITTFLAMMYIIVVNPAILSETGMPFSAVLTATVLISAFSSIMMGLYAKNPIAIAPGMGLNAFFTYTVVLGMGVPWQTALGAVFLSGVVFLLLSVFNVRTHIVRAIPRHLRYGIAAGIGLFIALIGFINAGFITSNPATTISIGTLTPTVLTFLFGLALTGILVARKVNGALLWGIIATTIAAIPIGRLWGATPLVTYNGIFAAPDFSLLFSLDLVGALTWSMIPIIFSFLFVDMFDSLSTFVGVAEAGGMTDKKGEPRNIKESLVTDSFATIGAGLFGTSSGTAYIESAAGIEAGGRSGLTAVIAGLLFLPFMFFSPLLSVVPGVATAPVLVLVGVFMMGPIMQIDWKKMENAIPAFLALVLIPLTYSISQGIIWGFLSWTLIKLFLGKWSEVGWTLLVIDAFAIIALVI